MRSKKKRPDPERQAQFLAEVRRDQAIREKSYRERALGMFPHVCARCCREFSGKGLSELTVHHKDSDHMNNPPDGSNWELLCLYCHDDEHQKGMDMGYSGNAGARKDEEPSLGFQAFEGLQDLLKPKSDEPNSAGK